MDYDFQGIVSELRNKERLIGDDLERLRKQVLKAEADLKRVREALRVMGEPAEKRSPSKDAKRGISRGTVRDLVVEILTEHGPLDEEELRSRLETEIQKRGLSRVGLADRMRQVVQEDLFCHPAGKIQVTEPCATAQSADG
jgi:hypothetical protein